MDPIRVVPMISVFDSCRTITATIAAEMAEVVFGGTYAGPYEDALIAEFDSFLPDTPPWK